MESTKRSESRKVSSTATKLMQAVFAFSGAGYMTTVPLTPRFRYEVPAKVTSKLIYIRAGNSSAELIYLSITRNKKQMRVFPIGAKAAMHVTLAINEEIAPNTTLELLVGAPLNTSGFVVLDIGLTELEVAV